MQHALTDSKWMTIHPILANNSRGGSRVDDRRVLDGIFRALRSVAPCYVLNGEAFRGQDRIELIDDALTSGRAPYTA
jgi:transposase